MKNEDKLRLPIGLLLKRKLYENNNFYLKEWNKQFYLYHKHMPLIMVLNKWTFIHTRNFFVKAYLNGKLTNQFTYDLAIYPFHGFNADAFTQDKSFHYSNEDTFVTYKHYAVIFVEYLTTHGLLSVMNESNSEVVLELNKQYHSKSFKPLYFYMNSKIMDVFKLFSFKGIYDTRKSYIMFLNNKIYYGADKSLSEWKFPYESASKAYYEANKDYLRGDVIFFYSDEDKTNLQFFMSTNFDDRCNSSKLYLFNNTNTTSFGYVKNTYSSDNCIDDAYLSYFKDLLLKSYEFKRELVQKDIITKEQEVTLEHIKLYEMISY